MTGISAYFSVFLLSSVSRNFYKDWSFVYEFIINTYLQVIFINPQKQ